MIDLIYILAIALVFGAIVGIVPGLNPLTGLILTMPLVANFSVEYILIFWVCYICVGQYYGSVGALLFKVPGETSSLPMLSASQNLKLTRSVIKSYRLTAFTSLVASLIGVAGFAIILWLLQDSWYQLFSVKVVVSFLVLIYVLMLFANGKFWLNFGFISLGLILANLNQIPTVAASCSRYSWTCFALTPADFNIILISIYAIPYLFIGKYHFSNRILTDIHKLSWWNLIRYRWVAIKHGALGFLVGFTPGMGTTLSSNISASMEMRKKPHQKLRTMAAAESANNSAVISSTVPFLFLGIPITGTELYLDNWFVMTKATNINAEILYSAVVVTGVGTVPFAHLLLWVLFTMSIICFILTSRFVWMYQWIGRLPSMMTENIIKGLIVLFTVITLYQSNSEPFMSAFTLLLFSAIGTWCVRTNRDPLALPVAIIIGKFTLDKFTTAFYLWS